MSLSIIFLLVSLAVLLLVSLVGIFSGMRKGAFRSLVKLGALLLSVILSLFITLALRGLLADLLSALIPTELQDYQALAELFVQLPASLALLVVFWVVFTIIRSLMLIPQKIICRMLPKTYDEFANKYYKDVFEASAPSAEPQEETPELADDSVAVDSTVTADETVTAPDEDTVGDALEESPIDRSDDSPMPLTSASEPYSAANPTEGLENTVRTQRIVWKVAAALCGGLSSLLLFGAFMMPISGLVTRSGNAITRVTAVMVDEQYGEYSDEINAYATAISKAPLFTVTDFFYGKTVFEPITRFKTEYGRIDLTDELENMTDILCDVLPALIHLDREGSLHDEDIHRLSDATKQLTESKFVLSVGTYAIRFGGDLVSNAAESTESAGLRSLQSELGDMMVTITPDKLADDLNSVYQLVEALSDSRMLKALTNDDAELSIGELADREVVRDAFGILYDSDHFKRLTVPLINTGMEMAFKALDAQPIYSDTDIGKVSRDEMLDEADRLCDAAVGLADFAESMADDDAMITSYRFSAAGKAIDCLRESIFFGDQYEAMVTSLSAVGGKQNVALMEALSDALLKVDSAEQLLTSAESIVMMNDALANGEKKGSENEKLVGSLDQLLNHTSTEDAQTLAEIGGDLFFNNEEGVNNDVKSEILEDCVNALSAALEEDENDPSAEADAVQALYDLTHSESGNAFAAVSEEETVEALLNSSIAREMLSTLNEDGRDYGVRAKLTDGNRDKISEALSASDADAASKAAVAQFFGIN